MSLTKYRAFIKVVETGNLTKTAKLLGYSQPGISHMINSLEKEVGFPLLARHKDAIVPTENGRKLYYYYSQIVKNEDDLRDTIQSLNGLLSDTIKISSLSSMLVNIVPKVLHTFSNTYSNIEIQVRERTFEEINEDLKNSVVDIGFTNEMIPKPLEFIHLFNDPVVLLIPKDHPFASYDKVPIQVLNGCDFIMHIAGFNDVIHAITEKASFNPNIKYRVGSDIAVIGMVANHLGVSVLSKQELSLLPDTVIAKDFTVDCHRRLGIALRSSKHATPALSEFIWQIREIVGKMDFS